MAEKREFKEVMKVGFEEMTALMDVSLGKSEARIEIDQDKMETETKSGLKEIKVMESNALAAHPDDSNGANRGDDRAN